MVKRIYAPKVIADPVYGVFDVRPVLPMIETEEFQALGDKRQLGVSHLVFPSATHSRRAHSLGAYHATRELSNRWVSLGLISEKEGDALAAYALYHDIGHPPFSHVTEDLCPGDNDDMGLDIIKRLKKPVAATGADHALVVELASHKNPLYLGVHDKNLGMEKLDYLERDGLVTILSRPAGIDYLRKHIYFMENELVIDEKVVDNAIEVQNFYLKMYKNVYLRKASVIAQRMIQKIVYSLLRSGELSAALLPTLTDSELTGYMSRTGNADAQALYRKFKRRELFREAIVVRPSAFANTHHTAGKPIAVFGLGDADMEKLVSSPLFNNKNQAGLAKLEHDIAELAGIPSESVLVVPVFSAWRFAAKDVHIYSERGGRFSSLRERYPAHFKNLEEIMRAYVTFRVCTTNEHRARMSSPETAKNIFAFLVKKERKTTRRG